MSISPVHTSVSRPALRPNGTRLTQFRSEGDGYEVTRSVLAEPGTIREFTRAGGERGVAFACRAEGQTEVQMVDPSGRSLFACRLPGFYSETLQVDYAPCLDSLLVSSGEDYARKRSVYCVEAFSGRLVGQRELIPGDKLEVAPEGVWLRSGQQRVRLGPDLQEVGESEVLGPDVYGKIPLGSGVTAQFVRGGYTGTLELRRAGDAAPFRTFEGVGKDSPAVGPDGRLFFTRNESPNSFLSTALLTYNPADDTLAETPVHAYDARLVPLADGRALVKDRSPQAMRVFTMGPDGKAKDLLGNLGGAAANIMSMAVSPDERQALVYVEASKGFGEQVSRLYLVNLDESAAPGGKVLSQSDHVQRRPFFLKDGGIAVAHEGNGVVEVFQGDRSWELRDPAAIRQLEVAGRGTDATVDLRALVARQEAPEYVSGAEQLNFSAREAGLPPEIGPESLESLLHSGLKPDPAVQDLGADGALSLPGDPRPSTVYVACNPAAPLIGITQTGKRESEFPLPAPPSGLLALGTGEVLTRAGDVLAVLEPYHAPDETLTIADIPLPTQDAGAEGIYVDQGAVTIGGITLDRRPQSA